MWLYRVDVWIYKGLEGVDVDVVIVWDIMGWDGMLLYLYIYLHILGCEDLRGLCMMWNA